MTTPNKRIKLIIMDDNGVCSEELDTIEEVEEYIRKVKGDEAPAQSPEGWTQSQGEDDE